MLIRKYREEDFEAIDTCITDEYENGHAKYLLEENSKLAFVAEEDGKVIGIAAAEPDGKEAYLFLYVREENRKQGAGLALLKKMEKFLLSRGMNAMSTDYQASEENRRFFGRYHFKREFTSELMNYSGSVPSPGIYEIRKYTDEDYLECRTVIREAFHKMQVSIGLEAEDYVNLPNDEQRKSYQENQDNMYVLLDDSKIVGALILDEDEIEDLAVLPELQGRGYGTELLHFGIKQALAVSAKKEAELWCIVGNTAREFYLKQGFKPERIHDIAYKPLHK